MTSTSTRRRRRRDGPRRDADEAPIIKLVNMILLEAIKRNASDIHVEPYEKDFRIRYRIDGVLYEQMRLPLKLKVPVTSRIKIISNLDIAERRLPQDGRIKLKLGRGREMDYRVSVCPTLFGEKTVLRLLDKSNLQLDMTKLGFEPKPFEKFKRNIHQLDKARIDRRGRKDDDVVLALSELNTPEVNLSTAEDLVEFNGDQPGAAARRHRLERPRCACSARSRHHHGR